MNPRHYLRLIVVTAAASLAVATVFAQNPATPPPAGAAPAQQQPGRGQIPIPQPCTPEQIAAAQAAAAGQTPDAQAAGRGRGGGRGGGVPCHMPDKREGLTPGKYDAGQVAMNLKLVSSMRQPDGMYDPNATGRSLDYANSDLAFGMNGRLALQGNFHGLIFYNVEDPARVKLETIVACPGGQGDVSIWGHLAFMSVEGYGRLDCGSATPAGRGGGAVRRLRQQVRRLRPQRQRLPQQAQRIRRHRPRPDAGLAADAARLPPIPDRMYGVRIFDITDPMKPRQVAGVQTCRGSHTHSLVTDPNDKDNIYIYVSGTSGIRSSDEKAGCVADPTAPNTSSLRHRRDQGAARASRTGGGGQSRVHLRGRQHRRAREPPRPAAGHGRTEPESHRGLP